ncbi:recombinase family protein [Enterococcus avium]|uniref:recombinase family protein n=1 Tax=Enterococcus avium TaxID=33945 RepID=UPI0034D17191
MIAIYCRTSIDRLGTKVSRKVQLDEVVRTLELLGVTEPYEVFEEIKSAKDVKHRPVLVSVLDRIEQAEFTQLWAMSLDRFSRKLSDLHSIFELCKKNNVVLNTVKEPLTQQNPVMRDLQFQTIGALREYQRDSISEYLEIAHRQKSEKGLWLNGAAPYGYYYDKGIVTVIKSEADIVQKVFKLYLTGLGYQKIVNHLNDSGLRYKGQKKFEKYHIANILKNVKYTGKIVNRFGEYEGQQEAIISDKVFNKARKIRESKQENSQKRIENAGLHCICPYCGRKLSQVQKKATRYYFCSSEQLTTRHERFYLNSAHLEKQVQVFLLNWINDKGRLSKMRSDYEQRLFEHNSKNKVQLERLSLQKEAIYRKYYRDKVSIEELTTTLRKIETVTRNVDQRKTLQRIQLHNNQELFAELTDSIQNHFTENSWTSMIDKVELTKDKEIHQIYAKGLPLLNETKFSSQQPKYQEERGVGL